MTREEARDQIVIFMCDEQKVINDRDKQALEMAIQALEQSSGDLISRQDAIKAIDEKAKRIKNEDTLNGLAGAVGILFDLPPVNPQEQKYCDRNICLRNEYRSIGCEDCEVTKSQEPSGDVVSRQAVDTLVDELARAISDERCCMSRGRSIATIMQNILDLPSVNPQPCEDAVDRQWLMRKATERFYTTNYFNHITKMIEETPSVKPQKSGEWMTNEIFADEYIYTVTFCSECEEQVDYRTDYCPYCGARMESE